METQSVQQDTAFVLTDPEWIALESLGELTRRFIFGDAVLRILRLRGLVEPRGKEWRVTLNGVRALRTRDSRAARESVVQ